MTAIEPAAPPHPADTGRGPAPAVQTMPIPRSEGSAIEMTRASAEVVAMVQAAKAFPRSRTGAVATMRRSCGLLVVAERAFYEYKRAGQPVTGPTIHLLDELAQCWQNITHGVTELRRDEDYSEAQAWAWDLQANNRVVRSFIVPHLLDRTTGGPKPLKSGRDIYERVMNDARRREREVIRQVLPAWFVDEAVDTCRETLRRGSDEGDPPVALDIRIADALDRFDELGVLPEQLEQKVDRPRDRWSPATLAALTVTYRSIRSGELATDEAFPPPKVTAAEIAAQAEVPATDEAPRTYDDDDPERPFA